MFQLGRGFALSQVVNFMFYIFIIVNFNRYEVIMGDIIELSIFCFIVILEVLSVKNVTLLRREIVVFDGEKQDGGYFIKSSLICFIGLTSLAISVLTFYLYYLVFGPEFKPFEFVKITGFIFIDLILFNFLIVPMVNVDKLRFSKESPVQDQAQGGNV